MLKVWRFAIGELRQARNGLFVQLEEYCVGFKPSLHFPANLLCCNTYFITATDKRRKGYQELKALIPSTVVPVLHLSQLIRLPGRWQEKKPIKPHQLGYLIWTGPQS
ncbi:MAG TPA: hypothetical protein VFR58_07960 [Flavisolibacter sp.]|nr:hypothetical protein [Flavisolibacter sp.]